ncbi:MAG TPA: hypothetical protein VEH29_11505 [Acidimicrobiales bacterium]|nr:hypothetical protein [Acidimicrobiales bacterium]
MGTVPEGPAAHETGSWKLWLGFLLALGWLLFVSSISFVRGTHRPRRPDGEPQPWEEALWGAIGIICFLGVAVALAVPHLYPHRPVPSIPR